MNIRMSGKLSGSVETTDNCYEPDEENQTACDYVASHPEIDWDAAFGYPSEKGIELEGEAHYEWIARAKVGA